MFDLDKIFLKYQKTKCFFKKVKKSIGRENKKLQLKSRLTKISIPFWIMKTLADSSVNITIIPKNLRKNTGYHLNNFIDFCFFSAVKIFKNLLSFRYVNTLMNYLSSKFIKTIQLMIPKKNFKIKAKHIKENYVYENMIIKNTIFSKIKTYNWKKNHIN